MARDPATVLAERRFDYRFGAGEWQHTHGTVGGAAQREPWLSAARKDLAALDREGYEVRPKTDDLHTTYKGRRFEVRLAIGLSGQPIETTHDGLLASIYPATDGDDPHTDHRGEPQGAPDP